MKFRSPGPAKPAGGAAVVVLATCLAAPVCAGEALWRSGEALYEKVCGHCHRPAVGVGTVLEGRQLPLEYLKLIVRNGFMAMPAFPETYVDDADLSAISAYLGSLPVPEAEGDGP